MALYRTPDTFSGSSASAVAREPSFGEPGYWSWENMWKRFGKGLSTAGNAMSSPYQATPITAVVTNPPGVNSSGNVEVPLVDSASGSGDIPQGEVTSADPYGYDQAQWEFEKQLELLAEQRAYNSAEAEKNRQWQERLSNTAYQRAVEDLEKAGLNKWLAVTGGNGASASTPSGSSATSSAGDASAPNPQIYKAILEYMSKIMTSVIRIVDFF